MAYLLATGPATPPRAPLTMRIRDARAHHKPVILPATAGRQTTRVVPAGSFALQPDGSVAVTPQTGFSGQAVASYTVADSLGRRSHAANLAVTVKPQPSGVLRLFSFETGAEGWQPASWQSDAGTVTHSPTFHSDGSYGLQVHATSGGWFGAIFDTPVDLSNKAELSVDLQTTSAGTSHSVALQVGDSWQWCQASWDWIAEQTTTTATVDLTQELSCDLSSLAKVQAIYLWFSPGTFYIDAVRAE